MPESMLKRVINWLQDKPNRTNKDYSLQELRDEFDSWINRPSKKKSPRQSRKRRTRAEGKAYARQCELKYGGNQNA